MVNKGMMGLGNGLEAKGLFTISASASDLGFKRQRLERAISRGTIKARKMSVTPGDNGHKGSTGQKIWVITQRQLDLYRAKATSLTRPQEVRLEKAQAVLLSQGYFSVRKISEITGASEATFQKAVKAGRLAGSVASLIDFDSGKLHQVSGPDRLLFQEEDLMDYINKLRSSQLRDRMLRNMQEFKDLQSRPRSSRRR